MGAPLLLFIGKGHGVLGHQMSPKHPGTQQVTNHGPGCGRPGSLAIRSVRPQDRVPVSYCAFSQSLAGGSHDPSSVHGKILAVRVPGGP
jgi:hypothetical protein